MRKPLKRIGELKDIKFIEFDNNKVSSYYLMLTLERSETVDLSLISSIKPVQLHGPFHPRNLSHRLCKEIPPL